MEGQQEIVKAIIRKKKYTSQESHRTKSPLVIIDALIYGDIDSYQDHDRGNVWKKKDKKINP